MLKESLRSLLWLLHLDITRNLKYDRLTYRVLQKILSIDSNCIDVGSHKGELLQWMIKMAPKGIHYAFEPIPSFYKKLKETFEKSAFISPYALSNEDGKTSFEFVKNAPAYSGLKRRTYSVSSPDIETIYVEKRRLDEVLPADYIPHLIKIDVEGAEFEVMQGSINTLTKHKPYILFEFGLGAADHYSTSPNDVFDFLSSCGLQIYTLQNFLKSKESLSRESFSKHFTENSEYYFIAGKK
ncbi:MAG: FkbM family methyltransferase [Bacteroidia bacterium]